MRAGLTVKEPSWAIRPGTAMSWRSNQSRPSQMWYMGARSWYAIVGERL